MHDLGELTGDVLVFGGAYSNLQAAQALIGAAQEAGIGPERVICTGDLVAYGADPARCAALLLDWGCTSIAGNCELQLAAGASDCGCGFTEGSACDLASRGWFAHADARIDPPLRRRLGALPRMITFTHRGLRHAVIHGGVRDVARFVWPCDPDAVFAEEIEAIEDAAGPVDVVLAGHCGIPFQRDLGRVSWVNAGVIGMPPHDGRPMTRYARLTEQGPRIERLCYDHRAARAAMENAGLVQGYHAALESGLWPSEDVLPPQMRRAGCHAGYSPLRAKG
ncbi:Metallophosphoesterase [Profundibacterium mesophilum KAUST100406-0324]|uniref:Metallophosphoesterase n=2 Tax=Profundibacterium TaxID=1258570 RepID=A0A921TC31_9RHOB|nr:Metallophosphoesterase [Profundibacterium mesophilum KAUST100406-0324]